VVDEMAMTATESTTQGELEFARAQANATVSRRIFLFPA